MKHRPLVFLVAIWALAAPARQVWAQAAAPEVSDQAMQEVRERIARGETLYESGDFDGALVEFQRAYDLLEGHPLQYLAVYNIGRCEERLFRYGLAMDSYRRYLELAGPDAEDRAEVEAKIEMLMGLLATVRLTVSVGGYEVWVDERQIGSNLTQVMVPGGIHTVEVRAPGYAPAQQQVNAPSRTEQTLTFALEELAEEFQGLNQAYFWASAGLAVVTVAVGAVFGGLALGEHNDLLARSEDEIDSWNITQGDLDHVSQLALTADILYGTAGLFAVAAIVLAFFTNWGQGDAGEEPAPATAHLQLLPSLASNGAGFVLGGRF